MEEVAMWEWVEPEQTSQSVPRLSDFSIFLLHSTVKRTQRWLLLLLAALVTRVGVISF